MAVHIMLQQPVDQVAVAHTAIILALLVLLDKATLAELVLIHYPMLLVEVAVLVQ
jgi:hypothetical protein